MDISVVVSLLEDYSAKHGYSLEDAGAAIKRGFPSRDASDAVDLAIARIHAREKAWQDARVGSVITNGEIPPWFDGSKPDGPIWSGLRAKLEAGDLNHTIDRLDEESDLVMMSLAKPRPPFGEGDPHKSKGLVLGYVQSGKTLNYSAVIAKAADEGYKLVIVLAGMMNNLRRQTQERLDRDLFGSEHWQPLTSLGGDFGGLDGTKGSIKPMTGRHSPVYAAVVKKNPQRLQNLLAFLKVAKETGALKKVPVLIIDDESDQATPNTMAAKQERSTINARLRDCWKLLHIGSYVAYTATPFANILMDVNDDEELFPSNFIVPLQRPSNYVGAEDFFGISRDFEDLEAKLSVDRVRLVPENDLEVIVPASPLQQKKSATPYTPHLVPSLRSAIDWFIIATTERRLRENKKRHSSMLVHTGAWTDAHFDLGNVVDQYLMSLRSLDEDSLEQRLRSSFDSEVTEATHGTESEARWNNLVGGLNETLNAVVTVVDNGSSDYRVEYPDHAPATVIAIGGNTLSRGLTLEGLIVSYFVRRAALYDTLLQMGRWFGYRDGYQDLVRLWTTAQLSSDFSFLAGIEQELRDHIERLRSEGKTPGEVGVRIRQHSGALEVTAKNKMVFAKNADITVESGRHQTTRFDESDTDTIQENLVALKSFVKSLDDSQAERVDDPLTHSILWRDVPSPAIGTFLNQYRVHPDHLRLSKKVIVPWVNDVLTMNWNVVLRSSKDSARDTTVSVSDSSSIRRLIRPVILKRSAPHTADIGALMPASDVVVDHQIEKRAKVTPLSDSAKASGYRALDDVPLLVLYLLDATSTSDISMNDSLSQPKKRPLTANDDIVAFGLALPHVPESEGPTYVMVKPDPLEESVEIEEEPQSFLEDDENDFMPVVDGRGSSA